MLIWNSLVVYIYLNHFYWKKYDGVTEPVDGWWNALQQTSPEIAKLLQISFWFHIIEAGLNMGPVIGLLGLLTGLQVFK